MTASPVWSEGLFLRPQHLQGAELAETAALHARLGGASAYPWGLVELQLDEDAASGAKVGVRRLGRGDARW